MVGRLLVRLWKQFLQDATWPRQARAKWRLDRSRSSGNIMAGV